MRLLALLTAALAVAGGAAGATARSVTSPGPVEALAFDGPRVAYASGRSGRDCDRVRIWNLATGAIARLGRRTACVETSTGTGVAAVSIASGRVLWLHYTGGNIREWSLFTATARAPSPRRLRFVARDVDAAAPIVLGDADSGRSGTLLPYAVGRRVVTLRADATRRFTWTAPTRVVALAAGSNRVAVAQEGGKVSTLGADGRVLREESYPEEILAVALTRTGILVQRSAALEYRDDAGAWSATLPARARLAGVAGDSDAVYVIRGEVHARRLRGTRDVIVGRGTLARVEGSWLATAAGRVVTARRTFAR